MTPEGFFDASAKGAEILTVVRGLEVYSIDQFYQSLYRPDLVREKLASDPNGKVKDATEKLDLAKLVESGQTPGSSHHLAPAAGQPRRRSRGRRGEAHRSGRRHRPGRMAHQRRHRRYCGEDRSTLRPADHLKQTVALDPGENTIELMAYNGANLVAAVPARTRITWTGEEPTAPPRLFVLVVGVNDYLDRDLKLTYAVPDADALASGLPGEAGQRPLSRTWSSPRCCDHDARRSSRLDGVFTDLATSPAARRLRVLRRRARQDRRRPLLPAAARHALPDRASLVSDGIDQDRSASLVRAHPAKKASSIFDTCEAGSLRSGGRSRGLEQKAALGRLIQATGRATLTASTSSQDAYEGYGGHGVFTFALLDALGGDADNNGLVELAELIQYVDGLVPAITKKRWGAKQIRKWMLSGTNFPLARQVPALAPAQDDDIVIPAKPTHVNTEPLPIFKEAAAPAESCSNCSP